MLSKHCIPNNVKKKIYIYRFYYFRIPLDDATLSFFKNKIDFDNAARGSRVARDIFDEDEFNKERGTRRRFANGVFVPCSVYFFRLSDDRYMQT